MTLEVRVQAPAAVLEGKAYTVMPVAAKVQAGIVAGEITDMQVVERVDGSSGRVISPPRLVGTLRLWSSSETHSVRLVAAKVRYLDDQWHPMKFEDSRTEETVRFTTHGREWLDPGQETIQAVDVAFPAEALTARKLTRLRLEIGYVASPYREEGASFAVSIGRQQEDR